jgi:hypothetical protein
VNVINITENYFGVSIIFDVFETTIFNFVGLSIKIRSCVVYDHSGIVDDLVGAIGCLADILDHDLIFGHPFA